MNEPRVPQVAIDNPIPETFTADAPIGRRDAQAAAPLELSMPLESEYSSATWVAARDRHGRDFVACSNCGEERLDADEEPHDLVLRVVRPRCNVGGVTEGREVLIEPRHLTGALLACTWSPREYDHHLAEERRRRERPAPLLMTMVNQSQAAHVAATKETNRRGRESMRRELEAQARQKAEILRRQSAPVDSEPPSVPNRRVDD